MTTTTETSEQAQQIADHLVDRHLAACVQVIGPIASTYRWQGAVERAGEYMCVIKTRRALAGEVEAAIRALHSYDNPEIVVVAIEGGSADYLGWIEAETTTTPTRPERSS